MAKQNLFLVKAIFILIILFPFFNPSLSCPQYQKEALLQFKYLLVGNISWQDEDPLCLGTWNSTTNCCQWCGVNCNSNSIPQEVTDLDVSDLIPSLGLKTGVTSSILTPLFHLQSLKSLRIDGNDIKGEISGIGFANLTEIEELYMSDNKLNGSIPPQFFSLRSLKKLYLSNNFIEGTLGNIGEIPVEIGNLTQLQKLFLDNNKFSGAIPLSLCHLKQLQNLKLESNLFSMEIPAQIGNFTNMEYLSLSDNNFGGEIPSSMQNMGQLEILHLEDNLLTGEIPSWLFDLRNLHHLHLGGNKLFWKNASNIVPKSCLLYSLSLRSCSLSGFPIFISNLTYLDLLDLSGNNLIGKFPKWLAKIDISELILSDNMLSGSLSPLLFQSTVLYHLDLSRNNFSGRLPRNIGDAGDFTDLILSGNDFSGSIPESISNISLLSVLDLSYNRLSGNKFPIFNTVYLDLSFNRFSGAIPSTYSQEIMVLLLSHNDFTGVLPQTLRNLTNLACIDFHDNNIRGEIPAFLSQISSLQILDFRNNFFQGQIPDGILSNLTSLQILDLSNNNFSGQVPPSLGKLSGMINPNPDTSLIYKYGTVNSFPDGISISYPDLEVYWKNLIRDLPRQHLSLYTFLDLSNNQLSGEIPDTLGDLKNLKVLNISHNKLSGRIPTNLGDMKNLESLDLSYNGLSGEIPQTFGKLLQLNNLELCNNKLTGPIPNGPQMDRLNNPHSFASNSGLCGMQIQVPCKKAVPNTTKPRESDENQDQGTWFSWVMAGIGFPAGFFSTVLVLYVIGYFNVVPKRQGRRRRVRRGV